MQNKHSIFLRDVVSYFQLFERNWIVKINYCSVFSRRTSIKVC